MTIRDDIMKTFRGIGLAACCLWAYSGCSSAPVDEGGASDPQSAPNEELGVASEELGACDLNATFQSLHQAGRCPMPGAPFCPAFCEAAGCAVKKDYVACQDLPVWGKPPVIEFSFTEYCRCGPDTCKDGIQNNGETGVDCGGPCPPCPTCSDGIQNQGETGVDCGGPCPACATCSDCIQNQGETGIDCGGPCPACETCEKTLPLTGIFAACPQGTHGASGASVCADGPCGATDFSDLCAATCAGHGGIKQFQQICFDGQYQCQTKHRNEVCCACND